MQARRGLHVVAKDIPNSRHQPGAPSLEHEAWNGIPWRGLERRIEILQRRIYQASQKGRTRAVHSLQRRLLASEAARLLAVRRGTQDNEGKDTAGVDGVKSLTPAERLAMAAAIHPDRWDEQRPRPARRAWIPKPGMTERRPIGILPMIDRCKQALVKQALEPEWEARFEPHSYGFRPERGARDAVRAIARAIEQRPCYVLDADIEAAFDHVNQDALLEKLRTFPALRRVITGWLKAGVLDGGTYLPTDEGIIQGGVLSPLLMNIALHGMERAATGTTAADQHPDLPLLVRYADDLVILHTDLGELRQATTRLREWLAAMGLRLNERKTRIVHTLTPFQGQAGLEFLGFMVCQYPSAHPPSDSRRLKTLITRWFAPRQPESTVKTVITPGDEASKRHLAVIARRLLKLQAMPQAEVIRTLNPLVAGWAAYYRDLVEPTVMRRYDEQVDRLLLTWARRRHPGEGSDRLIERYWRSVGPRERVFATPEGSRLCAYQQGVRPRPGPGKRGKDAVEGSGI